VVCRIEKRRTFGDFAYYECAARRSGKRFDSDRPMRPRAERHPVRIPVRYRPSGARQWFDGRTENISRSGILIRTRDSVPVATTLEMLLALPVELGGVPDVPVIYTGRVVRTEPATDRHCDLRFAATIAGYEPTHPVLDDPRRI
jgi:hypothetical protein